ncbi:glycerol-3-phosphate dehydrogenase [Paludibacterium yongneupense]|uniref:glycerol-3-phosphate dehydrogenase n=1 Tax=Paludibacterium yongneupense TaxID=400061 RepID=UPI00041AF026|nr:glycerol-3-phosphate dehydrogenase [Paludibacterium yongneupense]
MLKEVDVLVVGGGINGCGIANLAAQAGLSVLLVERGDLAGQTSSRSSKLVHGGLRYLETREFRLVREALAEREVLLSLAPHIVHPLTFVLPHNPSLRPAWMIRAGLMLYDHLGRRESLAPSRRLNLGRHPFGEPLKSGFGRGFSYTDCWADDARLVVLNALQASEYGASICTRTQMTAAERGRDDWCVTLERQGKAPTTIRCRVVINAAGPWAGEIAALAMGLASPVPLRLVKGSHIVVPRLYAGEQAYILQLDDSRIVFVLPYGAYNLIGTTDVDFSGDARTVSADAAEIAYLCTAVNGYFKRRLTPEDVVWSYAGVRSLYDDGTVEAARVTRDYHLKYDAAAAPLLSVYGGKLTTYRRLALSALRLLSQRFDLPLPPDAPPKLPGGVLPTADMASYMADLTRRLSFIPAADLVEMAGRHGSRCELLLAGVSSRSDLGLAFGAGLYQREAEFLRSEEWATEAEDVLWRRTKCGLRMSAAQREQFTNWWNAAV